MRVFVWWPSFVFVDGFVGGFGVVLFGGVFELMWWFNCEVKTMFFVVVCGLRIVV